MARKQRLKEVAAYHRGWEQYCTVLDAVSKQIEADYTKRLVSIFESPPPSSIPFLLFDFIFFVVIGLLY